MTEPIDDLAPRPPDAALARRVDWREEQGQS